MKFITYLDNGQEQLGVKTNEGVVIVNQLMGKTDGTPLKIEDMIQNPDMVNQLQHKIKDGNLGNYDCKPEEGITYLPSIPRPGKLICIGKNYVAHAEETKDEAPPEPIVFSKFSDAVAGNEEQVPLPSESTQVDYEAELAVVIGKEAFKVSEEEALQHVFGYSNANDLSARDLQFKSGQWLIGKTCPKFAPIGPYVVTQDEIDDSQQLDIKMYVNGKLQQSSNTSLMIFNCAHLIHYVSQFMVLQPGDVILTGTPEGVILGKPEAEREWLKAGDEMKVEIDKMGSLVNVIKAEE